MGIMADNTSMFGSGIDGIADNSTIRRGKMAVPNYIRSLLGLACGVGCAMKRHFAGVQQITVSSTCRIKGRAEKHLMTGGTEIKLPGIFEHDSAIFYRSDCRSAQAAVMAVVAGPTLNGRTCGQRGTPVKKSGQLPAVHAGGFGAIETKNFIAMATGAKRIGGCYSRVGVGALLVGSQNIGLNPGSMSSDAGWQGTMTLAADVEIRHRIRMIGDHR